MSLSPLTVLPCSPLEQVDAAATAGYDAVGLRLFPVSPTDPDVMADVGLQDAIADRLQATGLGVHDIEVVRVIPALHVEALVPALRFGARVGARRLAVTVADDFRPEDEPAVVARLRELADEAGRHGMGVMLEFMCYRGVSTLAHAERVVRATGRPSVGITLDTLHLFRSGGTLDDVAATDPVLLACVQLCDAPAQPSSEPAVEARHGRLYPGEGDLPLAELLAILPRDLPLGVEAPGDRYRHLSVADRAARAAVRTRSLLGEIDEHRPGAVRPVTPAGPPGAAAGRSQPPRSSTGS